jgi:hypothetical protein
VRVFSTNRKKLLDLHLECAVTVSLAVVIQAVLPIALRSSPA